VTGCDPAVFACRDVDANDTRFGTADTHDNYISNYQRRSACAEITILGIIFFANRTGPKKFAACRLNAG
jgi:hypothetical protein